ncbi:MAG: Spy/CpxP family protein refolding chaperone [Planctomycetota bacterium]|nr:MAG: Spy/CpxP family protein refolding chaperone [Planctomycetota bacterium]
MTRRKEVVILAMLMLVFGAISFFGTRLSGVTEQETGPVARVSWLRDAPIEVVELEESFDSEVSRLVDRLIGEQRSLGLLLGNAETADAVVMAQVEKVIHAHEHLMIRVGEHIIELRRVLAATQQERLMRLCAEVIRGPMRGLDGEGGWCGGPGWCCGTEVNKPVSGCCKNCVCRQDRGDNRGHVFECDCKWQHRKGRGLVRRLKLSDEQVEQIKRIDAAFEADAARFGIALKKEQTRLVSMFENPRIDESELLEQIRQLVSIHNELERRVAKHVLLLRPHLTVEQQGWLVGLCCRLLESR